MNKYRRFWSWLTSEASNIETLIKNGQSLFAEKLISAELDLIEPDIAWEIGVKDNEIEFTVSAQGDKEQGKILDEMFMSNPGIPRWKVHRYKQPKSLTTLSQQMASEGYILRLDHVKAEVALNTSNTKVDVTLFSEDFGQIPSDDYYAVAFFILDGVLGEQIVEEWIGEIKVKTSEGKGTMLLLSNLQGFVRELIEF